MIAHGVLTFYRSLSRHRLYAALNVGGLALGVAVFLVLILVVRYEAGFDRWLPGADQVYRVDQIYKNPGQPANEASGVTFVALPLLRADFPQVASGTRVMSNDEPVAVGSTVDSEAVSYVDPGFFDVFRLPLVAGNPATALASTASVVITERIARKYFATTQAVGRTLDISHDGVRRAYTVSAVLADLPRDTMLSFALIAPLTSAVQTGVEAFHSWSSESGRTYLRIPNAADAQAISAGLSAFVDRRAAGSGPDQKGDHPLDKISLSLVRLTDAHFHDATVRTTPPGVDRRVVASLGVIGALALAMAAINAVNLATARSGLRAREVALRKVMGATRRSLVVQFLGEATALVALAALIGLALAELAIPLVDALGGWSVRMDYGFILPLLGAIVLTVGVGSGVYPALLLSAYQPAAVLAAVRSPAGSRLGARLRNLLVLVQFAGAIAFAVCTLVIDAQAALMRDADRGFERQGLIVVQSLGADELIGRQPAILDALRRVPGVTAATISDRQPNTDSSTGEMVSRRGLVGTPPMLLQEVVARDYFATYGVHRIAGRLFDNAHPMDDRQGQPTASRTLSAVLNLSGVHALGFADPQAAIGQTLSVQSRQVRSTLDIIGVVSDVRFQSPREPVDPQLYIHDSRGFQYGEAAVRFSDVPRAEMMARLAAAWRSVAPDNPFVARSADERLAEFYEPDEQRARLFTAGAVLASAIACLGLYGLASFNTSRRVKEIGIRKTLGASTRNVLSLLIFQFIRPVVIATLIAWPLAWAAMRGWLSGFDERVALTPLPFIAVGLAALALSVVTVFSQAWLVAHAEPARALRYE